MNGLPAFADIVEPIVARAAYKQRMAESLAGIVADLLNKHEPLLKAECSETEIIVTERGGGLAFTITIEP